MPYHLALSGWDDPAPRTGDTVLCVLGGQGEVRMRAEEACGCHLLHPSPSQILIPSISGCPYTASSYCSHIPTFSVHPCCLQEQARTFLLSAALPFSPSWAGTSPFFPQESKPHALFLSLEGLWMCCVNDPETVLEKSLALSGADCNAESFVFLHRNEGVIFTREWRKTRCIFLKSCLHLQHKGCSSAAIPTMRARLKGCRICIYYSHFVLICREY